MANCTFCKIVAAELTANIVFQDDLSLAFLDHRPLFPGHCLLVPKEHFETLGDLPLKLVGPLFVNAQLMVSAVERALGAEGTFVAMNNRVSQSVPHFHVHIVPRRRKDGLKGFFWPRTKYGPEVEIVEIQKLIQSAIAELQKHKSNA